MSQGWRSCGVIIRRAVGPTFRVFWALVAVRAAVTRAPGPGQEPAGEQEGWG